MSQDRKRRPSLLQLSVLPFLFLILFIQSAAGKRRSLAVISNSGPIDRVDLRRSPFQIPNRVKRRSYYSEQRRAAGPVTRREAVFLESEHNKYRRNVRATNMEYMYYDEQLAASAQQHADRCDFSHSRDRARHVGENIWAAPGGDYRNAVWLWYREGPAFGCNNWYRHICGHYTQIVWHNASRFGCGFAYCNGVRNVPYGYHRKVLVCHYHYGQKASVPAFKSGAACSECPSHASRCFDRLCLP
jgi:hypothetical protein